MVEFKLSFCPQCGRELAPVPAPPITSEMYCSGCRLDVIIVRHDDRLVAICIWPLRTAEDGSAVPSAIAVEVGSGEGEVGG